MLLSDLKACLSSGFRSEVFITFLKLGTPDYAVTFPFRCFLASNQVTTQSSAFFDESYILFQYTFGAKSFNNGRLGCCWILFMKKFIVSHGCVNNEQISTVHMLLLLLLLCRS